MRITACVVGMVGGFFGIYFGLLLVMGTALFGVLASAFGGTGVDASPPFYYGLVALTLYTFGVAAGVVALVRPGLAAILLVIAGVGGLAATIAVGPSAMNVFPQSSVSPAPIFTTRPAATRAPSAGPAASLSPAAVIVVSFPFAGPVLLILSAAIAGVAAAPRRRRDTVAASPNVMARRGELIAATPLSLHSGPSAAAISRTSVDPGTTFDVLEQRGEFVHVRGAGFEGYLPLNAVRLV